MTLKFYLCLSLLHNAIKFRIYVFVITIYLFIEKPLKKNISNFTDGNRKKKEELPVYEQAENLDNPLRCPVKLYEFYLSKW
jgi:hypothetical protein